MKIKNENISLLVLDLDETLIHASNKPLNHPADFTIFEHHVYKRPYLDEFLDEVKKKFLIGIWSSASDDYVKLIVEKIIPKDLELEFVWGRSRCKLKRNFQGNDDWSIRGNYLDHYNYVKPLKKLKRQGFQIERILIVDDTPHKSKENYGNAIYPKEFLGSPDDDELKYLLKYLNKLSTDRFLFLRRNCDLIGNVPRQSLCLVLKPNLLL